MSALEHGLLRTLRALGDDGPDGDVVVRKRILPAGPECRRKLDAPAAEAARTGHLGVFVAKSEEPVSVPVVPEDGPPVDELPGVHGQLLRELRGPREDDPRMSFRHARWAHSTAGTYSRPRCARTLLGR